MALPSAGEPTGGPWGIPDAVFGWIFGVFLSVLAASAMVTATNFDPFETVGLGSDLGRSAGQHSADLALQTRALPLWAKLAVQTIPLWVGMLGAVLIACKYRGADFVRDLRFRFAPRDIVPSALAGLGTQLLLVPLIYLPVDLLMDDFDLSGPARNLIDEANAAGIPGVIALVALVAIGAPIVEEIFYRGLVLRSLERHLPRSAALVIASLLFAAVHFQFAQFPALAVAGLVFGYLAQRTGRLGSSIMAHMAFNTTTVVALLVS